MDTIVKYYVSWIPDEYFIYHCLLYIYIIVFYIYHCHLYNILYITYITWSLLGTVIQPWE